MAAEGPSASVRTSGFEEIQGGLSPPSAFSSLILCSASFSRNMCWAVNLNRRQGCSAKDGLCPGQQVMAMACLHRLAVSHTAQPRPLEEKGWVPRL